MPKAAKISAGAKKDAIKTRQNFTCKLPQDFLFPLLRTIARSTTFTMAKRTSATRGPFHKCKTTKKKRGSRRRREQHAEPRKQDWKRQNENVIQ
jgi:hypothetical protein